MTKEERRDIHNGIWMCRHHGNLVDADYTEYSSDTLRNWRTVAESRAAENLQLPSSVDLPDGSTLIQLGSGNLFHATWRSTNSQRWSFVLACPEVGNLGLLREYISSFASIPESDSYIVVESQGDARRLDKIGLRASEAGQQILEVVVRRRVPPTDPNALGADLKMGDDGDISPDFATVSGMDAAKQTIMLTMGVGKGELPWARDVGSVVSDYYADYGNDLETLARLIKMEFIRLSLIPVSGGLPRDGAPRPSLDFVKRFGDVVVHSNVLTHGRLPVSVCLEWGNGEHWCGDVPIFISSDKRREDRC